MGFRKANALKRRLLHIMPGADIDVIGSNLNWQRSARTHAADVGKIAECSLIVDATGDAPTALLLGAIAADNNRSLVSVQVFEGGIGALVARSVPGRDPRLRRRSRAYQAYCDEQNSPPPASGARRYEAFDDAGEPIVADDAAVSIAAAHGARVVLDVLDEAVDDDPAAWLLIGCRRAWLFTSGHGDVIRLDVGKPDAPVGNPDALEPAENPEAREFALELARSYSRCDFDFRLTRLRHSMLRSRNAGTREIGGQLFGEQLAPSDFRVTELTIQQRRGHICAIHRGLAAGGARRIEIL